MKKPIYILDGFLFGLCLPVVGLIYLAENIYKAIKRNQKGYAEMGY